MSEQRPLAAADSPLRPMAQGAHVYDCDDIWVLDGANQGDSLGAPAACELGDVYRIEPDAVALKLLLEPHQQQITHGSEIGAQGEQVRLCARYVMMAPDGDKVDILLISHDISARTYALPLSPLVARTDYTLIEMHEAPAAAPLADLVCMAFTTGTMITLAGGAQAPIESLTAGQKVLTRDNGPQPLRLIARATLRAHGTFAPVVISAGTLGNSGDLVVSPHHRIFLYRRGEARLGATSETLVQAKHLVDGAQVYIREGGYVDYYALVFERHEIIYAEGIPCESLLVTQTTLDVLPADLASEVRTRAPDLNQRPHFGSEAGREELERLGRDRIFKRKE